MAMNEAQQRVRQLNGGCAAIVGCPGSGKTRALVELLARCISEGVYAADDILAMTFTRAAASEMNQRLNAMGVIGARVGTIHSVCRSLLISETQMFNSLELDTRGHLVIELKKCLSDMRRQKKIPGRGVDKDAISSFISSCKARGCVQTQQDVFSLNRYLSYALYQEAERWVESTGLNSRQLADVYNKMERRRSDRGLYDFDDMLLWAWMSLLASYDVRARWRGRWKCVIVDETQDSNPVQWDIARMLSGLDSCVVRPEGTKQVGTGGYIELPPELCPVTDDAPKAFYVFGDSSQSIYRFRAAEPDLFVEFAEHPDTQLLTLPYNYRSTPAICALGTELVRDKSWHLTGDMIACGAAYMGMLATDTVPDVQIYATPDEEANEAISWALELAAGEDAAGLNSCAILSRTSLALHLAEIGCIRTRIPYRKMCSGSFFDSKEVKDILSYIRVACGLDASGWSLRRTINTPFRYISKRFIDECDARAQCRNVSLLDEMLSSLRELSYPPREALKAWAKILTELNRMAVVAEQKHQQQAASPAADDVSVSSVDNTYVGPAAMIAVILDRTDYIEHLRKEEGLGQEDGRVAILHELQRIAALFRSPVEFLKYVDELRTAVRSGAQSFSRKEDDSRPALTLSTIHRAKGLEWKYVRLTDVTCGRFPHKHVQDRDEELRLLYVAITRAMQACVVSSYATERAQPSEFIKLIQYARKKITGTWDV